MLNGKPQVFFPASGARDARLTNDQAK